MSECVFCDRIESRRAIAAERSTAVLFRDRFPVTHGHLLAVPKRHVESLFDLSNDELLDLWELLKSAQDDLTQDDPSVHGFNVGVNIGEAAGQTIPHAHVHLIPRRAGDIEDPRGGVRGVIPERMKY